MGGTLRYLLALGFAAVYFLVPEPDHEYLTYLKTRSWLRDTAFAEVLAGGPTEAMPPMEVAVTPPSQRHAEYARAAREWAREQGRTPDVGPPLALRVAIDEGGFRAELAGPSGAATTAELDVRRDGSTGYYPNRNSLLPAFVAIVLAILTAQVIPSLLIGCLLGAWLFTGAIGAAVSHFVSQTVWAQTFNEDFNLRIMGFVVLLFMAVGVMARSGGLQGMVEVVRRYARGPISSQVCSFIIGVLIFFDDYSNCIITGTTMRPLTDRNRVSREKLAYLVDSTAAPIAGISIVSTWVAYEVSMFKDQLPEVTRRVADAAGNVTEVAYKASEGFSVFVQTLPYRFYCIFTLLLVVLTILLGRDFGPMLRAERRARHDGKPVADDAKPMVSRGFSELQAPEGAPIRGRNAFVPVVLLVLGAIGLMLYFGYTSPDRGPLDGSLGDGLRKILNNAQSELALVWASGAALFVAAALALGQRILTLGQVAHSAVRSLTSLIFALVILVLAWCMGHICADLGTAQMLTAAFQRAFEPWLLPILMFLLAALVSFSTGTSYGTMAILLPNVVVLAHSMGETDPTLSGSGLMILTIGAVLEGSIFGDHCSPISDTTVLSSVASGSDHLHHVQTQAPYAVLVMVVAMVCGYLPMALISRDLWPVSLGLGVLIMAAWLLLVGRRPGDARAENPASAA
ncbi:MAG: Na+/H+ antiporter NhaC family protein [Planctomycetota bacterium]